MSNKTNTTASNPSNVVTIDMVRSWQGSDNLSSTDLLELITEILNEPHSAEKIKQDVLVYNEVID